MASFWMKKNTNKDGFLLKHRSTSFYTVNSKRVLSHVLLTTIFFALSFSEIEDFKARRIKYFQKNLVALAELQIKHAKVSR